jgi:hypothetical protein
MPKQYLIVDYDYLHLDIDQQSLLKLKKKQIFYCLTFFFSNLPKPDVSAKADPTPCKLLARNKTLYERPNANVVVDKKMTQSPIHIGIS